MKKITLKFSSVFSSLIILTQIFSSKVFAINPSDPGGSSTQPFTIPNLLGFKNLGELIKVLLQLAYFVAGLALFFNLVIGGIQWINAGGDEKAMSSARRRITNAVIGLIIVVAAAAITAIISQVFGISILEGFKFK